MPGIPKSSSSSSASPPLIKASIPAGDQLVPVIGASSSLSASLPPSLGATISLAQDGVSLVSFITTAGSAEDTYERNPEQGAPARREPWNVDNNST